MNWNWYLDVLKNRYAQFDGRAHREEFWTFVLVNILVSIGVAIVAAIIHLWLLRVLYSLAVLIPSIALGARRLHDTNKSAWLLLIGLIPLIGWIVLIVFYAQEGDKGPNPFGPDPRETMKAPTSPSAPPAAPSA